MEQDLLLFVIFSVRIELKTIFYYLKTYFLNIKNNLKNEDQKPNTNRESLYKNVVLYHVTLAINLK